MRFVVIVSMNSQRLRKAILSCLMAVTCSGAFADASTVPPHWYLSGDNHELARTQYSAAVDHSNPYEGTGSGVLKSTSDAAQSGTLMQTSSAAPYRGKNLKISAFLRSNDVARRTGLWIRADDINGITVAFRNCFNPRVPQSFVEGTTDWKEVEISIEIPESAVRLSYGVQLIGTGEVSIDNVAFDVIGPYSAQQAEQVHPTAHPGFNSRQLPLTPQNLDFEQ